MPMSAAIAAATYSEPRRLGEATRRAKSVTRSFSYWYSLRYRMPSSAAACSSSATSTWSAASEERGCSLRLPCSLDSYRGGLAVRVIMECSMPCDRMAAAATRLSIPGEHPWNRCTESIARSPLTPWWASSISSRRSSTPSPRGACPTPTCSADRAARARPPWRAFWPRRCCAAMPRRRAPRVQAAACPTVLARSASSLPRVTTPMSTSSMPPPARAWTMCARKSSTPSTLPRCAASTRSISSTRSTCSRRRRSTRCSRRSRSRRHT